MQPKFRVATEKDLSAIVALCNKCFEENTPLEYAEKVFAESRANQNQIYIVGEAGGKIVAHGLVNIIPTMYDDMRKYAILNHICVDPEVRRGGIGTKLLDACFAVAEFYGCKTVDLWSKNFRTAAHGLYKKYGFEVLDAKFFEKELGK